MRVALVGTELAPVREGAGALESLLTGWAAGLARAGDEVHVISVADHPDRVVDTTAATSAPGVVHHPVRLPGDLPAVMGRLSPDVAVLDNRPGWVAALRVPCLLLAHNWPDAWELGSRPASVGRAGAAAVSSALAGVVAAALGRPAGDVPVVHPFVSPLLLAADPTPHPDPAVLLAPNRLLRKKGVVELAAAARSPRLDGRRVLVTDYLSPWRSPTGEHRELREVVAASPRCRLIPPPPDRRAMAACYARAAAVVVPSLRPEGFGMVAAEAQALGVPVVSSGRGGLAESTLRPELVADPSDPDALADALVRAAELGHVARLELRTEARRRFGWTASVAAFRRALASAAVP